MAPARAEDLVYVHSNLRLLSRRNVEYVNTATKMLWDIVGDSWNEGDIHGGAGILENAALTLDKPELEAMVIGNANTSAYTLSLHDALPIYLVHPHVLRGIGAHINSFIP